MVRLGERRRDRDWGAGMIGDPTKKDFPREPFMAFLRSEIERLLIEGADPDVIGVYAVLLRIYESENNPGFYVDLYYRYYREGFISHRAAALAALYAFVAAPSKHPLKAIEEGDIDTEIAVNKRGMAMVPAWILQGR